MTIIESEKSQTLYEKNNCVRIKLCENILKQMLSLESKVKNKIDMIVFFCVLIVYYGNLRVKLVYSLYLFNNWEKNISSEMLSKSNTMKFNSLSDDNQNKL